jgi:hypothetical protein
MDSQGIRQNCNLITCALITTACQSGLGIHQNRLTTDNAIRTTKLTMISEPFQILAPMFARISMASLMLSILSSTKPVACYILWAIVVVQIVENIVIIVELYAQCGSHVATLWNPDIAAHGHCISKMPETVIAYLFSGSKSGSILRRSSLLTAGSSQQYE